MEPKDRNQEIARLAVARGMLAKAHADACMREVRSKDGTERSLDEILLEKGYITRVQRDLLLRETAPTQDETRMVGGYQLIKMIGKGGMGSVYRARQVSLERIVALKVLNRQLTANQTYRDRFLREARAAAAFNHPNIVRAIDAGEDGNDLYFAMELVDGKNVAGLIKEQGPFSEDRAASVVRQIASALAHAWRHRIIHRDIKPENILIDRDGVAKLTDLGLAKFTGGDERRITQAGMAMGTPYYISPEQIRLVEDLDVRADLYALGATFFHIVTGRPPYLAESPTAVVSMHLDAPVPDPRVYQPSLSPELAGFLMRSLAKDRKARFQTPEEFIEALDAVARNRATAAGPLSPSTAEGGRDEAQGVGFGMIMAVVTLMAVAALIYFLVFPPGNDAEDAEGTWPLPDAGREESPTPPEAKTPPPETKTVEKPDTRPTRPPPRPTEPLEHEKAYREAEAYLEEHPEDFAGVLERLAAVREKFAGTTSAVLCAKAAERIRRRLDASASPLLFDPETGIVARANRLEDQGRFPEGLALFDTFPAPLRAGGWKKKLEACRETYLEAGRTEVETLLGKAKNLASRRRFQQALEALRKAGDKGVPGYERIIEGQRARVRALRADRLFAEFVSGLATVIREDGLLSAEAYLARWAKDPDAAPLKDDLPRARETLETLRNVLTLRDRALRDRIGRPVDFRLKDGHRVVGTLKTVAGEEAEVVMKGMRGAVSPIRPSEIGIRSLHDLCGMKGGAGWKSLAAFQILYLGDLPAGRQCLRRVSGWEETWMGKASVLLCEEAVSDFLQRGTRRLRQKPEEALRILRRLREVHGGTSAYEEVSSRAVSLLRQAGRQAGFGRTDLLTSLYARVLQMGQDRLKLIFDFRNPAQLRDLGASGSGLTIEDGTLFQAEEDARVLAFLPLRWRRYVLECNVELTPDRGDVGILFHYQGAGQYFMFRLVDDGGSYRVRAGLYQPVLAGRGIQLKEIVSVEVSDFDFEASHHLKLGVEEDRFRGLLDGKRVFVKEMPCYGEGGVALRAGRPAAFTNVTIVGEVSD